MNSFRNQSLTFALIVLLSVVLTNHGQDALSAGTTRPVVDLTSISDATAKKITPANTNLAEIKDSVIREKSLPALQENPQAQKPTPKKDTLPPIGAVSYRVSLLGTNNVLIEHGSGQWPIASLTKLMTAEVARELIPATDEVEITANAIKADGDQGNFTPGEKFTRDDLIRGMLLVSSNDAAEALAEHYGRANFITAMNDKARELKMTSTNFNDPSGLSYLNQSTMEDMTRLATYIYETSPVIFSETASLQGVIKNTVTGASRTLSNINTLAGKPDFRGGKTGYTDASSGNLLSLFRYNDATMVIIVFGTDDRFGDTIKLHDYITGR